MAGTSLAALPHAQQALVKSFERSMKRSASIVAAAQRAPDLEFDAEGNVVPIEGATKRQMRIAQHALLPAKSAPVYLTEAYRDYELAQKLAAAAKDGGVSQVARAVVLVVEKPVYERVELHRDDAIEVEGKPTNG
mgnify:CR=1 FL=1